ncbi:MAG: hypothetical protein ACTSX3_03950, partial [Candidatus Thorarchaeota archaeon]
SDEISTLVGVHEFESRPRHQFSLSSLVLGAIMIVWKKNVRGSHVASSARTSLLEIADRVGERAALLLFGGLSNCRSNLSRLALL